MMVDNMIFIGKLYQAIIFKFNSKNLLVRIILDDVLIITYLCSPRKIPVINIKTTFNKNLFNLLHLKVMTPQKKNELF